MQIKPVRDSITEALQLWKFIAENREVSEPVGWLKKNPQKLDEKRVLTPVQDGQTKCQNICKKSTVMKTKKKGPPLNDKELNPEFFQRLQRRVSGEVEVVVNRRYLKSSNLQNEEEPVVNDNDTESKSKSKESDQPVSVQNPYLERGGGDLFSRRREFDNNVNLLGIQRQLLQLEKQQTHLMNMLQV